ncbi:YybH family protein [Pseudonocardia adelaidensis]|uniref:SnoaL-like domain-containing protein n=1 Tax=Pseudonocardia adelaidensis TaxID=648754 RepID=A0ABP9NNV5_9PSEU
MSVQNPGQLHQEWEKAFNGGDIDGLVALYEPGATVIPQPGNPVTGHAAIREALGGFLALHGQFQLRTDAVVECGDIAVGYGSWTLKGGTDPDGNTVNLEGRATDVMRKQPDGSWLDVIDDPYSSG